MSLGKKKLQPLQFKFKGFWENVNNALVVSGFPLMHSSIGIYETMTSPFTVWYQQHTLHSFYPTSFDSFAHLPGNNAGVIMPLMKDVMSLSPLVHAR